GGATFLLPSLDHSPALKLGRRHLVESSQESGLHAGKSFERWAVVGSEFSNYRLGLNFVPPDIDASVPPVLSDSSTCPLPEILKQASNHTLDLIENMRRFSASEQIEQN